MLSNGGLNPICPCWQSTFLTSPTYNNFGDKRQFEFFESETCNYDQCIGTFQKNLAMDETAKSGVRTRKRNKSIKDSAKLVILFSFV